jgi:hypothetical protein
LIGELDKLLFTLGRSSYFYWDNKSKAPRRRHSLAKTDHLIRYILSSKAKETKTPPSCEPPSKRPRRPLDNYQDQDQDQGLIDIYRGCVLAQLPTRRDGIITFFDDGSWYKGPTNGFWAEREMKWNELAGRLGFGQRNLKKVDFKGKYYLQAPDLGPKNARFSMKESKILGANVYVRDTNSCKGDGVVSINAALYKDLSDVLKKMVFDAHLLKWVAGVTDRAHRNVMVHMKESKVYTIDCTQFFGVFDIKNEMVKSCSKTLKEEYMKDMYEISAEKLEKWKIEISNSFPERREYVSQAITELLSKGKTVLFRK